LECGVRPDVALRSLGEGAAKSGRRRRFCLPGGWVFNHGRSWAEGGLAWFFASRGNRRVKRAHLGGIIGA